MTTKRCARCGRDWLAGDEPFITCPNCRIPDRPTRRAKRGCRRFEKVSQNKADGSDPSPMNETNTRRWEDRSC